MSGLTIDDPVTLSFSLISTRVLPGDVLLLKGGTYNQDFVSELVGAADKRITIKARPGETVIIDGSLQINGAYTTWEDIIFTHSGWLSRTTDIPGSGPADMQAAKVLNIYAHHTRLINCIVHDNAGIYPNTAAYGSEIYGNLFYHFGWSGPDRGHCHGIYAQNQAPAATVIVEDNISFQHFSTGLKFYGESAHNDNYEIIGNTCFNNGILYDRGNGSNGAHVNWNLLVGGLNVGVNVRLLNNMTYHSINEGGEGTNAIGWGDGLDSPVITGNYLAGRDVADSTSDFVGPLVTPTITGNTFVGTAARFTFYEGNTFVAWPGSGTSVFVRPNKYKTSRANVTIYNWDSADSVTVDLSAVTGLAVGSVVRVRNVQDYFMDIVQLTLDANKRISVDMRAVSHTVAAPILWAAPVSTFPVFGCFVVDLS